MATCIAVCHALHNNKNKKMGKKRCLVFLIDLVLFCSVILSLQLLCLMNQGRTTSEGWSTTNQFKPPSNFIAGRPKAALLFWFFGGFRCGVPSLSLC